MPATHYTESACDACPRHCRAGIFIYNSPLDPRRPCGGPCPDGVTPAWVVTTYEERAPNFKLDKVTKVNSVISGTLLLGCAVCSLKSPCLYEVTGPGPVPPCTTFSGSPHMTEWFRVTE